MRRALLVLLGSAVIAGLAFSLTQLTRETAHMQAIRVGILHSSTGSMAASERPVRDATRMAVDEINAAGGLLGRPVEAIVRDGQSDPETFGREAERLIAEEGVSAIFGCWTSAARKIVKPVVERHGSLLFYPLQYEGLEQSPNIVYTGATPNQQIIPGVKWATDMLGDRVFLVGSDYVFPRTANAIIRDLLGMIGGTVVGEEYVLLGSQDVTAMTARIAAAKPDVILNTINGDTNRAFFRALAALKLEPRVPVMSFSIGEPELEAMDAAAVEGHYAVWNYFQTLRTPENDAFVAKVKALPGHHTVSDPMEAAYIGVHLWAQAVSAAGSTDVSLVRRALGDQSMPAPEGVVYLDPATQHTWKWVRVGKIRSDRLFDIVWDSGTTVRPMPFPMFRTHSDWERFLRKLQAEWGGAWSNPAGSRLAGAR